MNRVGCLNIVYQKTFFLVLQMGKAVFIRLQLQIIFLSALRFAEQSILPIFLSIVFELRA